MPWRRVNIFHSNISNITTQHHIRCTNGLPHTRKPSFFGKSLVHYYFLIKGACPNPIFNTLGREWQGKPLKLFLPSSPFPAKPGKFVAYSLVITSRLMICLPASEQTTYKNITGEHQLFNNKITTKVGGKLWDVKYFL